MSNDRALREQLRKFLNWEDAHVNFDRAVAGLDPKLRGVVPNGQEHSVWQLVEHLRLTLFDILDFCRNPKYVEMTMEEHWPPSAAPANEKAWTDSIGSFHRDLEDMQKLALNPDVDLFAKIPQGTGQTYLRAVLLVADHNAYHVAQIVSARRALGAWNR